MQIRRKINSGRTASNLSHLGSRSRRGGEHLPPRPRPAPEAGKAARAQPKRPLARGQLDSAEPSRSQIGKRRRDEAFLGSLPGGRSGHIGNHHHAGARGSPGRARRLERIAALARESREQRIAARGPALDARQRCIERPSAPEPQAADRRRRARAARRVHLVPEEPHLDLGLKSAQARRVGAAWKRGEDIAPGNLLGVGGRRLERRVEHAKQKRLARPR